ncbi:MAG: thioredoxin [Bacteroidota bacterium]
MATLDFQAEVIDKSFEKPIVVDFWAAWCGPCQVLGPVITGLAEEAEEHWELVKVDTEANQEIAQQYQIMSIPNVKMFYKGEVIAEFAGALPKSQIQKWLDENLPSEEKAVLQDLIANVRNAYSQESIDQISTFADKQTDMQEAQLFKWWAQALHHPEEAASWVNAQPRTASYADSFDDILSLAQLAMIEAQSEGKFFDHLRAAKDAFASFDLENGMKALIQAVMLNKSFQNDLPRRSMIALFRFLGEEHITSKKLRPYFNMALY